MKTLTTTMEDYLETIAELVSNTGGARVRDISAALAVQKSTVTAALRSLASKGLVNYAAYEAATLTPSGQKVADDVIRRHEIVRSFFMQVLALDREVADANACRMEHILDPEVLDRLGYFAEFVKCCPSAKQRCLKQFQAYYLRCSKNKGPVEEPSQPPTTPKTRKSAGRAAKPKNTSASV